MIKEKIVLKKLTVILILLPFSIQAKDNIEVYNAYGNTHQLYIQGRMLYKKKFEVVKSDDGWLSNLWRRAKQTQNDEISSKKIRAIVHGEKFSVRGDDEGYFEFNITLNSELPIGYEKVNLTIEGNPISHEVSTSIIGDKKLIGIISDFDDTIIVSEVSNPFKLILNTVFKNYQQRTIISTMKERFKTILSQNPDNSPSTLFILTGSPQHLFRAIEGFLKFHHFPEHTLLLKKAHGDNKDSLTEQFAYKTKKIEHLIQLYPNMQWVMFGDSGEKDREVYHAIAKKYPHKIQAFYIRDVKSGKITKY